MKLGIIANSIAWLCLGFVVVFALQKHDALIENGSDIIAVTAAELQAEAPASTYAQRPDSISIANDSIAEDEGSSAFADAVVLNDSGVSLLAAGNAKDALTLLQRAVQTDSSYARAHFNLGISFASLNHPSEAIREYKLAAQLRPSYYKPLFNLGLLYSDLEDYEEAAQWLAKAISIRKSPDAAPAHYRLGRVLTHLNDTSRAIEEYNEALRLRPGYIEPRYSLAMISMDAGKYELASIELERVASLGFARTRLYRNLGICYSRTGNDSLAIRAYRRALQIDTADASLWYNLAVVEKRSDLADEAIASYTRTLEVDSNFSEAWFNLASIYNDKSEFGRSLMAYRHAVRSNPSYSKAWYNLGLLYSDLDLPDSAAAAYERVVEYAPDNTRALFNLGLAYNKMDSLDKAADAYRKLIDVDPVHEKGLNNLGAIYLKVELFDSAHAVFNRLVGLTHSAQAFYNRAKSQEELGNPEKAIADYRRAIEKDHAYARAYHNLALLEEDRGDLGTAVELLNQAIVYEPNNWKTHWKLGKIYIAIGRTSDAKAEYALAAKSNPDSKYFSQEYSDLFEQ